MAELVRFAVVLAFGLALAPSGAARAQRLIRRIDSQIAGRGLGVSLASPGDLDGDGVPDIVAGGQQDAAATGIALALSGATGETLYELHPVEIRGFFGASLAASGDLDGDGVPDLIVGAPFTTTKVGFGVGAVLVFSGATGKLLYNFTGDQPGCYMGSAVSGVGDLDGDGIPELMMGTPYGGRDEIIGLGNAFIHSGRTGELIARFDGEQPGDYLGAALSGIEDVDGDGVADLLLAAPFASPEGRSQAGALELRSGASGDLIYRVVGTEASAYFGRSLAVVGDLDGDGILDFAAGAPNASPGGLPSAGEAFAFSGATGALIFRWEGFARFDEFGAAVAGGQDVDGDGIPDVVVGAPGASPGELSGAGSAFVFSGATGQLLFRWDGQAAGESLGRAVALIGDLDGDGRAEVLVGAPYASPNGLSGAGTVFVLSF